MVVLSLLNVANSAVGRLTSKAYTASNEFNIQGRISTSGQWSVVDNYTINATFNGGQLLSAFGTFDFASWEYVVFNGYSGLNYKLEYAIEVYAYNSNTKLFESPWIPNGEICYLAINDWQGSGSTNTRQPRFEIYLRRNEFDDQGNRRWLVPSDMRPSSFNKFLTGYQNIEQQTLPSDWFATTTQSISSYTTQTTVVTTVDYESYVTTLTVPTDVRYALSYFESIIYSLWSLKYIPFIVIFAIIVALCGWLLH